MNGKDVEFIKTLVLNLKENGFKEPFELTQRAICSAVRNYYEYGTEKSVITKLKHLKESNLLGFNGYYWKVSDLGLKIG